MKPNNEYPNMAFGFPQRWRYLGSIEETLYGMPVTFHYARDESGYLRYWPEHEIPEEPGHSLYGIPVYVDVITPEIEALLNEVENDRNDE